MKNSSSRTTRSRLRWLVLAALVAVAIGGCMQWRELVTPPQPPDVGAEWRELLADLRTFERKLGYRETKNFASLTEERESFPFCGHVSRFYLPYSYQDPAVRWFDALNEEECRSVESETDVFFGYVEALGEVGTPVTPAMISGKLDRFVYLVIHEDCHDQFDLPYGIEEALCNVITYRAMALFAAEKFRWYSRENRSIKNYPAVQAKHTRVTIAYYEKLEALYARYQRKQIPAEVLMRERETLFSQAERALELEPGQMNNLVLASFMTYSRHYPYIERVFDALGGDLGRAIAFFREVDKRKPAAAEIMKRHRITDEKSLAFLQAYEAAIIETIAAVLAERKPGVR